MIEQFLEHTVTIVPKDVSNYDKWGDPTEGTGISAAARVQEVTKRIRRKQDDYIDVTLEVWLGTDTAVAIDDGVTWNVNMYRVLHIVKKYDMDGMHEHTKVYCA